MGYHLAVFSPETHAVFTSSRRTVMGFPDRHSIAARKIVEGDVLVCYMTRVSRWVGVLRVDGPVFADTTPLFVERADPYVLRFPVTPIVWLGADQALSVREDAVWNGLTFTKNHTKGSSKWTGALRTALVRMKDEDGELLERLMLSRAAESQRPAT